MDFKAFFPDLLDIRVIKLC